MFDCFAQFCNYTKFRYAFRIKANKLFGDVVFYRRFLKKRNEKNGGL
jgi:hypothetical protein